MMLRALSADWMKIRGKGIWFLTALGPIGLVAMQGLNFGLRYDYLMNQYADDPWGGLLHNIANFVPIALFLGITLISSLMANVEHQLSSWKQLLALPISRTAVFSAKFVQAFLLLTVSCILLSAGTAVLGLLLGMSPQEIPYVDLARVGFAPMLAAIPLLAIQLWMSMTLKNQGLPVGIGITASVVSVFTYQFPNWMPLKWPVLAYVGPGEVKVVGAGLCLGLVISLMGLIHFNRRDVN
ncbi:MULTISPECIES: ABC transporter permease [Paenibacillus]|uniref:Permease n=1 Tax=Paenibacillus campinasensis TaxID=66347 RepID=A0A268EDW7_9BACL|nr:MULTISPECIES: ABC transporter permease [Paenibacillus]PAD71314.1 permease [Paenibacillus campinasensis]PAK49557.1 permease [Paenibacillus sp. 7541]